MVTGTETETEPEDFTDLEGMVLDGLTGGESREDARAEALVADAEAQRRAARTVWRLCNQHGCTEGLDCVHPNHRRDIHYFRTRLAMLNIELAPEAEWDDWFHRVYTAS